MSIIRSIVMYHLGTTYFFPPSSSTCAPRKPAESARGSTSTFTLSSRPNPISCAAFCQVSSSRFSAASLSPPKGSSICLVRSSKVWLKVSSRTPTTRSPINFLVWPWRSKKVKTSFKTACGSGVSSIHWGISIRGRSWAEKETSSLSYSTSKLSNSRSSNTFTYFCTSGDQIAPCST